MKIVSFSNFLDENSVIFKLGTPTPLQILLKRTPLWEILATGLVMEDGPGGVFSSMHVIIFISIIS